jgi:hypothetical protein
MPGLFSVPKPLYQSTPCRMTCTTLAMDSTLLTMVGLAYSPFDCREGGLHARMTAESFQTRKQSRLFATFVCACTSMDNHLEVRVGAKDALAQESLCLGFLYSFHQACIAKVVFTANIDKSKLCLNRIGTEDDPFDQLMGVILHDHAILEGARLRLVGVHHQIARLCREQGNPTSCPWGSRRHHVRGCRLPLPCIHNFGLTCIALDCLFGNLVAAVGKIGCQF